MLDWQKRLLDEAADMNEKVENLEALLDLIDKEHLEPLPEEEVLRLRRQHIHMLGYYNVLCERIQAWHDKMGN